MRQSHLSIHLICGNMNSARATTPCSELCQQLKWQLASLPVPFVETAAEIGAVALQRQRLAVDDCT